MTDSKGLGPNSAYPERSPHAGWSSTLPRFREASAAYVSSSLQAFVRDASVQQIRAWDDSIAPLQREAGELLERTVQAEGYSAIFEYQLPMEARRPDVVLLLGGPVLVLELKGKSHLDRVDIDQAAAYARDLRGYHRECTDRTVEPVLVLMNASGYVATESGVQIVGPDVIDEVATSVTDRNPGPSVDIDKFLDPSAYRPLPSLVEAARQLLESGEISRIGSIDEKTGPTLALVSEIAREAARTRTRRLVLLTGLPGTGRPSSACNLPTPDSSMIWRLRAPTESQRLRRSTCRATARWWRCCSTSFAARAVEARRLSVASRTTSRRTPSGPISYHRNMS